MPHCSEGQLCSAYDNLHTRGTPPPSVADFPLPAGFHYSATTGNWDALLTGRPAFLAALERTLCIRYAAIGFLYCTTRPTPTTTSQGRGEAKADVTFAPQLPPPRRGGARCLSHTLMSDPCLSPHLRQTLASLASGQQDRRTQRTVWRQWQQGEEDNGAPVDTQTRTKRRRHDVHDTDSAPPEEETSTPR